MEPVTIGIATAALKAFGGKCFEASFAAGIVGSLIASVGYDHSVKDRVASSIKAFRELVNSGVPYENHDLLRAVWIAQENALVLCCEDVLLTEKRLKPGGLAIPTDLMDFDAWLSGFGFVDPDVKLLLTLRASALKRSGDFAIRDIQEIIRDTVISLKESDALFMAGAETGGTEAADRLRTSTTTYLIAQLKAHLPEGVILPICLEDKIRERWFDFMRFAFREVLKRYPNAKSAFEFQIWEKIEGIVINFDTVLKRTERMDVKLDQVVADLREVVNAVNALFRDIRRQHAQTSKSLAAILKELSDAPAMLKIEARLTAILDSIKESIAYSIGGLAIRKFELPDPPTRELQLLEAKHRTVKLLGRDADLSDLIVWLGSESATSARLIVGGAGSGKTRLAFELLLHVNSNLTDWRAGTVDRPMLEKFVREKQLCDWSWNAPTLLVIDYAQTALAPLTELLNELTHRSKTADTYPLRILLLERQAGAWFDDLLNQEDSDANRSIGAIFEPPSPVNLAPVPEGSLRRAILEQTLLECAKLGERQPIPLPGPGADSGFENSLEREIFENPLNLMLAALVADECGLLNALRRERIDLSVELAKRELKRVERYAPDPSSSAQKHMIRHLIAVATLQRGITNGTDCIDLIAEELAAISYQWPDGTGDLSELLSKIAGGEKHHVAPVLPDFVGEALILSELAKPAKGDEAKQWLPWCNAVRRSARRNPHETAATLLHSFQNFGHRGDFGAPLLAATDALIGADLDDADVMIYTALEANFPKSSVELRKRAVEVTQRLYDHVKGRSADHQQDAIVARLANNLANRLGDLGRRDEALTATEEAVSIDRKLAERQPDAFLPNLAVSLHNFSIHLGELGRHDEALAPAEEAFTIRLKLAERQPVAFLPDLAASHHNLGIRLSELGRRDEALAPAEKAASIYRKLAERQPDAFLPALAMSLNNLGHFLSELGQCDEALAPAEEAVAIRRKLAERQPDAFLPDLAMSLNNLGHFLSELGRCDEALAPAEEAVAIRRKLAERQPDAFLPDLAASLDNLGIRLSKLGRRDEARAPVKKAVSIYRKLAERQPDAFLPDLATSLNNLAALLNELGRRDEALAPAEEAVSIRRKLAERQPSAFLPDLATSLNNLANSLSNLGRHDEALAPAEEAVDIRSKLAERQPDAFLPDLATSLNNLAIRLRDLGLRDEALDSAEEAVSLYHKLAERQPDAFFPHLAASVSNLAALLNELGRRDEALAHAEEALTIRRKLAERQPDAFLPDLAISLYNFALFLSELGRRDEALGPAQEAVSMYRKLAERQPDVFLPNLAMSLSNFAFFLSGLHRNDEALPPAREAFSIRRKLAEEQPDAFLPDLAASLNNLALFLSNLGRLDEALAPAEEVVAIRRKLVERQPDVFIPDLGMSLNNLAYFLYGLERLDEALAPAEEAVSIRRKLAERQPDAFLPDLAGSLNNLATFLSGLGRRDEALAPAEEAVSIIRKLAERQPDAFLPDLAMSLNTLASRLSELGRRDEALAPAEEAVSIYRKLAERQADAFLPGLAASLNNLADLLNKLGRRDEALAPAEKAASIYRKLAERQPDAFLPDLAQSYGTFGEIMEAREENQRAFDSFAEGIASLTQAFQKTPQAFAELMDSLLNQYKRLAREHDYALDEELLGPVIAGFQKLQNSEKA